MDQSIEVRILKAPANEETLLRKHCSPGCFFDAQTTGKQCLLAVLPKKHFTGSKRLRMLNLGNKAYATTESSQHCFLGAQPRKHLLWKQNVSEKNQKHFLLLGSKQCFQCAQTGKHTGKHNVSATVFPRLWGPLNKVEVE